jgi:hypothetical protein
MPSRGLRARANGTARATSPDSRASSQPGSGRRPAGAGSRTVPPPTVIWGPVERKTKRSPGRNTSASSSRRRASASVPGGISSPARRRRRALVARVPWCSRRRAPCARGFAPSSTRTRASRRRVEASGAESRTSPGSTSPGSTPVRSRAVRAPAWATSAGRPWFWTPRTLGRCPEAEYRMSPARTSPLHSVPVTTTPIPFRTKERSTGIRASAPSLPSLPSAARPSRAARRSTTPSPVTPLTRTMGALLPVSSNNSSASSSASSAVSSSAASILVRATTPRVTPRTRSTSRCSRVCGITPSSAATTSRKASTPVEPATMFLTNRS